MSSVSATTQRLINIVHANSDLQDVWVRGTISGVRHIRNHPLNFTLEDESKKIECVIPETATTLGKKLPAIGNNVTIKGNIILRSTISQYQFKVTDINLLGTTLPTQPVSVSTLKTILKTTLSPHTVHMQGIITNVIRTPAKYTILKLKDITAEGQSDNIIECVLLQGINPPFALQIGERVQVTGKFGTFSRTCAYRIEIDNVGNIMKVSEKPNQRKPTRDKCKECHQYFSKLQNELCQICHNANLTSEGIVVGAVMRYFDTPKFASFSTKREYEIRFGSGGNIVGRADVALMNREGNPVAIAECKKIGYDGNDGMVQLESYINPTVAKLGLFADNTDPYEWTFVKRNDERIRYEEISRSQFERELGVEPVSEIPPGKTCIELVNGNIIEAKVDAIVNAANSQLTRGNGVDGAIRDAGGEKIDSECQKIFEHEGVCPPGSAVITTGGNLSAKYVIHAIGPIWQGGNRSEAESLTDCYMKSLQLAAENRIRSIAFPAISTGHFGFPIDQATSIALKSIKEFVERAHQNDEMVPEYIQFVLYDEETYNCYVKELSKLGFGISCLIG